jgi:hypothetical protein
MMIAKIVKGASFRGALNYVLQKDGAEIVGGNMSGETPRELSTEFSATRKLNNKVRNAVYHVSLSLPQLEVKDANGNFVLNEKGEKTYTREELTDDQWGKVATKYLARMGLDPLTHQYTVARHHGTDHDHIHIIASRIDYNGKIFEVYNDRRKSLDVVRALEKDYGLTQIPSARAPGRPKIKQGEYDMQRRTGRKSEKTVVSDAIREILGEEGTIPVRDFCEALEARGIIAIPGIADNGRVQGFSFQYGTRNYSGSTVGQGWKYLSPRLEIRPEDIQYLRDRKNRMKEGTLTDALRSIRSAVWDVAIHGTNFVAALEKQGWVLDATNDNISKGGRAYHLPDLIDTDRLEKNLKVLEGVSEKQRQAAREKARELTKKHYADKRRSHSVFSQLSGEDLLGAMILFNSVFPYLLVLMVVAELIRVSAELQGEKAYQAQIRAVWKEANRAVQTEIRNLQQEVISHGRTTGSHTPDKPKPEEPRRELREEDGSRRPRLREVGKQVDRTPDGLQGRGAGNADRERQFAVAQEDHHRDDSAWVFGGDSPSPSVAVPARGKQSDVSADTVAREVVGDVSGFIRLAGELSILAGGEIMRKSEALAAKERAWERQRAILGDDEGLVRYRITCVPRPKHIGETDPRTTWIPGQRGDIEEFYTADQVRKKLTMLSRKNLEGYDIYVRPMTAQYMYVMIDDLSAENVAKMKADGLTPNGVWTTSQDNFQVLFRLPRTAPAYYGDPIPEAETEAGNALVRRLTAEYGGDAKNLGIKKAFRLAGFANKKPERNSEFCRIVATENGVCLPLLSRLEQERDRLAGELAEREAVRRQGILDGRTEYVYDPQDKGIASEWCIKDFVRFMKREIGLWKYLRRDIDQSAIDFQTCVAALKEGGYAPESVADALLRVSPELSKRKGSHVEDYIQRTVSKAIAAVERDSEKREAKRERGAGGGFLGR